MVRVFVSIGSNVDKRHHIEAGLRDLRRGFGELRLSPVYESRAVGFEGDNFYNLVAAFDTALSLEEVSRTLTAIEDRHGRDRRLSRFGPRTLDLDLLLYGNTVRHDEEYDLPRKEITRYAFVLRPLAELAPAHRHPELGKNFAELWRAFEDHAQPLWPVRLQGDQE